MKSKHSRITSLIAFTLEAFMLIAICLSCSSEPRYRKPFIVICVEYRHDMLPNYTYVDSCGYTHLCYDTLRYNVGDTLK